MDTVRFDEVIREVTNILTRAAEVADAARKAGEAVRDTADTLRESEWARSILDYFRSRSDFTYEGRDATMVSRALHRVYARKAPRIALVGQTSAGKSTLLNALFGVPLSETSRTPDTTTVVFRVPFPSGLVLYDTPGLMGGLRLENVTRAFLGIPQIPVDPVSLRAATVASVPFRADRYATVQDVPAEDLNSQDLVDSVLWVVDTSRTPTRPDLTELARCYDELLERFGGRVAVAGTKLDQLSSLSEAERETMLSAWSGVSRGRMCPVSSTTGEGLDDLVLRLFQSLSDNISLQKLQESLQQQRRLDRLEFVVTQAGQIMSEVAVLRGRQVEEAKVLSVMLFALICNHYSVDEETWTQLNGDAIRIGEAAGRSGLVQHREQRDPSGFWEWVLQWWGGRQFYTEYTEVRVLGGNGVAALVPRVYQLLHQFEGLEGDMLTEQEIEAHLAPSIDQLDRLAERGDVTELSRLAIGLLGFLLYR
jgi:GTP-binding protein EngB required for normal cell division